MNPVTGKITSPFGIRIHPITSKSSFHTGVDIACKIGTPVVAPADGRIVDLWKDPKGGISLSMITKDGKRFGFAHLQSWKVNEGQDVKEGYVIAFTGNSGKTTGPHLHMTLRVNGLFEDPLKYFDFK